MSVWLGKPFPNKLRTAEGNILLNQNFKLGFELFNFQLEF